MRGLNLFFSTALQRKFFEAVAASAEL